MLRHRYHSSSNLSDGRVLDNRVRCVSNGQCHFQRQEMQKCSDKQFRRTALLPNTEKVRGNRNPPLLMVKPIKRYEETDRKQNARNDVKV